MANTNENLAEISDIKLFPNPAENKIVVQYLGSNSKIVQLVIFNQYGQAVLKAKTIEKSEQEFDISSFQQGGYFVKITLANGQSISKKFIKL
jgi:type IX secretion system substrate protein